ncbi:pyridoxamine 5'-phosphate oxidase family protein [Petroclostridium sp. X23]|uniref:pyridoxamine 5'-phosphate oxidase family protein n=1 Tax=Petroclostridium sp. X23 TaxID=3045146 RepID=UPI0024AD0BE1|nr:pyridoxamine 5'-phosphate oxidase family protein [Petroclostridium sp. X23]WHH60682.1 pyridoxamine 5'-phosphate oxidase family protein [Petroclostridium sp. X23]
MFRKSNKPHKVLDDQATLHLLKYSEVGVLGTVGEDGYPYAVPLNYVYYGNKVAFHCANHGHKIDNLQYNSKVCFTVIGDHKIIPSNSTSAFTSAIVFGTAHYVENLADKKKVLDLLMDKYAPGYTNPCNDHAVANGVTIVEIDIQHISGKHGLPFNLNGEKDYKSIAIKDMKMIFGDDTRRINHALKVLSFSEEILNSENVTDQNIRTSSILSAVLHDIGIHAAEQKHGSNSGKYQEIEGPGIARPILDRMELPNEMIDRICYIIGNHHTKAKNDGLDFQILWESDLLVNIEEENITNKEKIKEIINKNFVTETGKKIAAEKYL